MHKYISNNGIRLHLIVTIRVEQIAPFWALFQIQALSGIDVKLIFLIEYRLSSNIILQRVLKLRVYLFI